MEGKVFSLHPEPTAWLMGMFVHLPGESMERCWLACWHSFKERNVDILKNNLQVLICSTSREGMMRLLLNLAKRFIFY